MRGRIDYANVPEARGMYQLEHLVKMRASQINECAYCFDMHSKDVRALGESEKRLYMLDAWEEALFCSERTRGSRVY